MTDTELLVNAINESGYKRKFIAESLGIAYNTLWAKVNNTRDFTTSEVKALQKLLKLSDREAKRIFFAAPVDN